jgi:translation initiation factor 1
MSNKKITKFKGGLAYSTDSSLQMGGNEVEGKEDLLPSQQKLKVRVDSKHRSGKTVTLVENFIGTDDALESLCKTLKTKCGCGGSAKDGIIIIQGAMLAKAKELLEKMDFGVK